MPGGPIIPAHVARRVGANLLKQLNDATSYQRYSQTRDHVWDGD